MNYIFDLMLSESLFFHEVLQIGIVELLFKNFLGNWPDLVDINDSGLEVCSTLPHIECIAHPSRYHVANHGFLLRLCALSAEDLPSRMHVVKVQPVEVDLVEGVAQLLHANRLLLAVGIELRFVKVFDHLEGRHDASIVELLSRV